MITPSPYTRFQLKNSGSCRSSVDEAATVDRASPDREFLKFVAELAKIAIFAHGLAADLVVLAIDTRTELVGTTFVAAELRLPKAVSVDDTPVFGIKRFVPFELPFRFHQDDKVSGFHHKTLPCPTV